MKVAIGASSHLLTSASADATILIPEITPEQLLLMNEPQILSLQEELMMGSQWLVWEVAPEQIRPGHVTVSQRSYRIELALRKDLDPHGEFANKVWCELMRVVIGMRLFPQAKAKRPTFSYVLSMLRQYGKRTRRMEPNLGPSFWSEVCEPESEKLLRYHTSKAILRRLHLLGALADCITGIPRLKSNAAPRHRLGEGEVPKPQESIRQFMPLPDQFVGKAGFAAIFFATQVGPTLLAALEAAAEVEIPTRFARNPKKKIKQDLTYAGRRHHLKPMRDRVISAWKWEDPDGMDLISMPMDTQFGTKWGGRRNTKGGKFEWPPKSHAEALSLLVLLQGCHLWIIAFATAGRHGEVQSLEVGTLRREDSHAPTAGMPRWKIQGLGQAAKEVPLPKLVVAVVKQQERLAAFAKRAGGQSGDHLWVQVTAGRGRPIGSFHHALKNVVARFELEEALDGAGIHMHRFRKTLVRAVALSLVHAPKVLMDVLGHDDEQMTIMRYILSDPGILDEIHETVREMIILKGVEVVERRHAIEGAGAGVMKSRIDEYARRVGDSAFEPQNVHEFASAMTENGQGWAIISPGVVCTGFTRGGLCNKQQTGGANPHYCNPACQHQIILPTYERDGIEVDSAVERAITSIDYLFAKLRDATDAGEEMLVGQFIGQIKSLMGRWSAVDRHAHGHSLSALMTHSS
ncbi:TPA: site-specific integrase [Stenotrophomonas maltophilia]